MISISINGEDRTIDDAMTISDLVHEMAISGRYAVEVNQEIISRSQHEHYSFTNNDTVEIVTAVGGG